MNVSVSIPSDLQEFILSEVATGTVSSEGELVTRALELYREMRNRHSALTAEVQQSLAEADRGDVAELDVEATIARGVSRLADDGITD